MNILMPGMIRVPDSGRADERFRHWAGDIETLTSDRVIWAYQFGAESSLHHHAVASRDKAWKKGITKLAKRC